MGQIAQRARVEMLGTSMVIALFGLSNSFPFIAEAATQNSTAKPIVGQTSTMLPDGRRLLLGGFVTNDATDSAFIYEPKLPGVRKLDGNMVSARAGHTATTLPDGRVLVFGGYGKDGKVVVTAEVFSPETEQFQSLNIPNLVPRSGHTSAVTITGAVLVVGGVDVEGTVIDEAEQWDPRTGEVHQVAQGEMLERIGAHARVLFDGSILYTGGKDKNGQALASALLYESRGLGFREISGEEASELMLATDAATMPQLIASVPLPEAKEVPPDGLIAVLFSSPVDTSSIVAKNVVLIGPSGETTIKTVLAEEGVLLFITPAASLLPGTRYTLFLDGIMGISGQKLGLEAISFTVATLSPGAGQPNQGGGGQTGDVPLFGGPATIPGQNITPPQFVGPSAFDDDEAFVPTNEHRGGRWRTGKPLPNTVWAFLDRDHRVRAKVEAQHSRRNGGNRSSVTPSRSSVFLETGIAGTALRLNDKPLANATITVGNRTTHTDSAGQFRLTGLAAGRHELLVDGSRAGSGGRQYAQFAVSVDIKQGEVSELGYPLYVPRVRAQDWIDIASPVQTETVVTHPAIPDLQIIIPRGTILRSRTGKILTRIAIVPVPLDRPPFPVPGNFPVYFLFQPGGAVVHGLDPRHSAGIRIVYPNLTAEAPGSTHSLLLYDSRERGWFAYGTAKVSADGRHVVPAAGVGLYEQMAASYLTAGKLGPQPRTPPDNCKSGALAGDPVDCSTGVFFHQRTDIVLSDVLPLSLTRTYRPGDSYVRALGVGTSHNFEMYLRNADPASLTTLYQLITPEGSAIDFPKVAGLGWQHTTSPGTYHGAVIKVESPAPGSSEWYYAMTLKNGMVYSFDHLSGLLVGVRDRSGNNLLIIRNGGMIQRIITSSGRYLNFGYHPAGTISQIQDIAGRTWAFGYTTNNYLNRVTYPDNSYEEYTYDGSNRLVNVRDRRGNTMLTNQYDTSNRVIRQTLADGGVYQFNYTTDGNGMVTQTDVTDPRGNIRRMTFNNTGLLTSQRYAQGTAFEQTVTFERQSGTGFITARIDPLGHRTEYTYDVRGNVASVTRLAGTANSITESFIYDPTFDLLARSTNGLGHATNYSYNDKGNLVEIVDPLGNRTTILNNTAGQPIRVTLPTGEFTLLDYDLGDLRSITDPLGRVTTRFTDVLGRLVSITDPFGRRSRFEYDVLDRTTLAQDALGQLTQMTYDNHANLLTVTDPRGGLTQHTYDAKNRLATRVDPLNQPESFQYDGKDNLSQHTDRKGQVTDYVYDAHDRLTQKTYADGGTVAYVYDGGDRLVQAVDSISGTITRGYDDLDRLTSEASAQGSVTYSYDAAFRRIGMQASGQGGIGYTYDNANRLTQITQGTGNVTVTYDASSRRIGLVLPGGIEATYGYDAASQLTSIAYQRGGTVIGDLIYTYDSAGQRTRIAGSLSRTSLPDALSSATYDVANRLMSWNGTALAYDANGNMLSDGTRNYTWDARNRLTSVIGTANASFQYDAFGRRAQKTAAGTSTNYLYDGPNPVQELNGTTPTANLLTGTNIDEFFRRTDSAGSLDFLTDSLGSVLALADSTGTIQTNYTYEPFGKTTTSGAVSNNSYQYTGRENDGTGLYYYRARYYDPTLQRFISSDPIGLAGGLNTYAYVFNNPMRSTDPTGELPPQVIIVGAGAVVGGLAQGLTTAYSGWKDGCFSLKDTLMSTASGALAGATTALIAITGAPVSGAGFAIRIGGSATGIAGGVIGGTALGAGLNTIDVGGALSSGAGGPCGCR